MKKTHQEIFFDMPISEFGDLLHLTHMRRSDAKSSKNNRDVADICHYTELIYHVVKPRGTEKAL